MRPDVLEIKPPARVVVVDRVYPLEAIADAYRYVETKQKTGIVVISPMRIRVSF